MSGSTKDAILSRIRRANGARPNDPARAEAVAERLWRRPLGVIPERGQLPDAERVALFERMASDASATVVRIASVAELPEEVARYLRDRNLPATLRMGEDPRFLDADFTETTIEVSKGPSDGDDLNSLSYADAGIAETGTLVLTSGPDNPTSLNFLPENHMVAISAADIGGDMEAAFLSLRERFGNTLPRTVNTITGPSRSADIEQTLLLGAHGPKALHIMIVG